MSDQATLARIEAAEKNIANIFCEDYAFSIPAYQRPYAWERQQVDELLTDLEEAMSAASRSDGFYFLGSIVLVKQHGKPDARVVDGQQRITTLTIIFSVLRDMTSDPNRRRDREEYIKQLAKPDKGLKEILRLHLRKQDQAFFEKTIQRDNATNSLPVVNTLSGSQARIVQNAQIVRERFIDWDEEKRTLLISFLLQTCFMVVVEVPTDTAARRIFTVLNARGLDLIATDILKADLLERAGEDREDDLSERWENIETMMGRDNFSDLFVHIRMIHQREKPRTSLEAGFPEHVAEFSGDPEAFLDNVLEPYADAFALAADDHTLCRLFGQKTVDLIRSLNRLDNKDWMPPLLLCLRKYKDAVAMDVSEFLFKLERLSYFLFVTRADVNARMARYADVLNVLDNKEITKGRSSGLELSDEEAKQLFNTLNGDIYTITRVVKPLLLRLDQASTDGSASYDHATITVEHVCPQTIEQGSQWDEWFSDRDQHDLWLHRLGNLVLLNHRKNPAASNWDFERKKDVYFMKNDSCPFVLTQEARGEETWKIDDIKDRQKNLVHRLAKAWGLEKEHDAWRKGHEE